MIDLRALSIAIKAEYHGPDVSVKGVCIDSRGQCAERCFIALRGPHFDAHDYVQQAELQGASALMVERRLDTKLPQLIVQNTYDALTESARWWRQQINSTVIGVTGSNGKTTLKTMLASIFSEVGATSATVGNLNNEIGVPLTLLSIKPEHEFAVVEMGMNHAGEIERLSTLASPDIAIINNAGPAHIENLGSLDAIAAAKGEIFSGLSANGIAVINADDAYAEFWRGLAKKHSVITFGFENTADLMAEAEQRERDISVTLHWRDSKIALNLPGRGHHMVMNALAASATALALGVTLSQIKQGLERMPAVSGRLQVFDFNSTELIDDSYNANPASVKAGLDVLATRAPVLAVLGNMAELGEHARVMHQEVGRYAAQLGIDALWACGEHAQSMCEAYTEAGGKSARAYLAQQPMIEAFEQEPDALHYKSILVKGSRSAHMENVVAKLKDLIQLQQRGEAC